MRRRTSCVELDRFSSSTTNAPCATLLAAALRGLGYRVLVAEDGAAAVEIARGDTKIDAVLLDMVMPRMDGKATYLALREVRPDVRVVLTTGFALNEEAQRIMDLGVREFDFRSRSASRCSPQVIARTVAAKPLS